MNLSETQDVLEAIRTLQEQGRKMALATIVDVKGSTYRRPGARLLVAEAGDLVGNISGGCLEGEVQQVAREVMAGGDPRLELYDLTADDEVVWGWGLGCNGAIEVFIEPADKAAETAGALRSAIESERPVTVVTVLSSSLPGVERGARVLLYADGGRAGSLGDPEAEREVLAAPDLRTRRAPGTTVVTLPEGEARVFVEALEPPLRLLVCGAGHDAIPLVRAGAELGWSVHVVDDRPTMLNPERFPEATGFVNCEPAEVTTKADVDGRTYVVVMSHNYLRDRDYLRALLRSDAPYLGMLGPKQRTERLLDDLASQGLKGSPEQLDRIHGPAGLDLGAEGPEEIAAAIVAEVLAVSRTRGAGFLRERSGSIHDDGS